MKKQFKAESKRLLDLMINSIYTHKEIFLRELISNASDALDKRYYLALSEKKETLTRDDLFIRIETDGDKRLLRISDNGIGMDDKALEDNLGIIAKSGSLAFASEHKSEDGSELIGQFGVGFYSAFMVAKSVKVISLAVGSNQAYQWLSSGQDGYTITKVDKAEPGTIIELELKDDGEDEDYSQYLRQYTLENLIGKYSDYIRWPIKMMVTTHGEDDAEVLEDKTLNSMVPIWKRVKSEISEQEYNDFYKEKFFDFNDPLKVIHTSVEGNVSFEALLFIPSKVPYGYYTKEYERGLQLYSHNVFIMDKAKELIGEHFRFVRGLVDSQDLSLNISREMLQQDRQLKLIASRLEKKIKSELLDLLKKERETYEKFWANFGVQLKYGIYADYGSHKELLEDLLLFYSSEKKGLITLQEYVDNMKEEQKEIYYASGSSVEKIDKLPQVELVRDKGFDILYLSDEVDEFALSMLGTFQEKKFKSILQGDLDFLSEEEKEAQKKTAEKNKDLLEALSTELKDQVKEVRLSSHLKSHAVCLVAGEGVSLEMEKVLSMMPENANVKAERYLEINSEHPLFAALSKQYKKKPEQIGKLARLLYDQALLIAGFPLEDPIAFADQVSQLMVDNLS
ncbi:MAG: molecular chaperone HtpG [Erysipelotrichaceae bacterium]|jgi:molecular chaperone HtpG|nr:molecular chaperone HtpG [Erysipelotrichaceae bacterium]